MSPIPSLPTPSPDDPWTFRLVKADIIRALLRLYPEAWRREYGPELADMLMARPLGAHILADVVWNGLRQRVRLNDASTFIGAMLALIISAALAWNIAAPLRDQNALSVGVLEQSSMALPTVDVTLLRSEPYVLLMMIIGCWTYLRGGRASQSGLATMKITLIASLPVMLTGLLMLVGVLGIAVWGPEYTKVPLTSSAVRLFYTYPDAGPDAPGALAVLTVPFLMLPGAWLYGMVGGLIGRGLARVVRKSPVRT